MKCKDCKACDHWLCTINIHPYMLKKSRQIGCSLNHIQVDYHIRELAPTNRQWLNSLDDETFDYFLGSNSICDLIQECFDDWCSNRENCKGCIETWLKQKHLEDS